MDCSAHVSALLSQASDLPPELVNIIESAPNSTFLAAIASATLNRQYTDTIFTHLEPLFAEICARWTPSTSEFTQVLPAFGRIIPFAPHLAEYAQLFLSQSNNDGALLANSKSSANFWNTWSEDEILETLLGAFRLLVFDNKSFARCFNLSTLQDGLGHTSRPIRYLTIRVLCVYLHAADAALEEMISKYLEANAIYGIWESKNIDFRFLSLWEEKRSKDITRRLRSVRKLTASPIRLLAERQFQPADLSPMTVELCGILMPRLGGTAPSPPTSKIVTTQTTISNVRAFAEGVLQPKPVLLTGLAGAGKTTIVNHCAQQLNKLESMVTLHLNEQSDAKLLVGMYTSGSTPGTFTWRPGALTTAVREGRWVFIEDLDRAPNEIISTLLPLIERGELLIPSRGERIKAAHGFKIVATMRTHLDLHGKELLPRQHMVGSRFWHQIPVTMLSDEELSEVISKSHPKLQPHISRIIGVYSQLIQMSQNTTFSAAIRTASARPLSPRDLFKWCDRMASAFPKSSDFTESSLDGMFLEAVDCFVGYLPAGEVFQGFVSCIAQELHIDPTRRDHLLYNRQLRLAATGNELRIGRGTLSRVSKQKGAHRQRFFANSPHTLRLLERLAVAVGHKEPMLLVGETGIGKTTCIQQLADQTGRKLVSFNLSQQSESGDLLGGFKPVNVRGIIMPLKDEFDELFNHELSPFRKSKDNNTQFTDMLVKACAKGQWRRVCTMWKSAIPGVEKTFKRSSTPSDSPSRSDAHHPRKKQRVAVANGVQENNTNAFYQARWRKFAADVSELDSQLASKSDAFAFKFIEGSIVKAVRNGDWVLLDEINLATPDTLEALVDLLGGNSSSVPSLLLTETGKLERITAHPNFRVFAAMNPATDVGKKDLPLGIRSRFTEVYVDSPDRDMKSLLSIVQSYLPDDMGHLVGDVTNLYCEIQSLADANSLVDGAGQKPHFSLRTLTRTLTYARDVAAPIGAKDGVYRRALYEGFHMSFLTLLDNASETLLAPKILHHLFGKHMNANSELKKPLPKPSDGRVYAQESRYWIRKGSLDVADQPHYIITPFVRRNLDNLIRAVSTRKLPILIQGPTSSGKTSMIEYLAKKSGNKFVRINNHEHTDLQEYLGTYVSGNDGRLRFQEGILVEALRKGHWIVLDELNLAPSDVLEALNRLLDDNRELLIPETQEVVTPHPGFMLFATQNPAGLYGGRKHLSRAFRNRFLELHFDDIPVEELCEILHKRTQIPPSWGQRIVDTYKELSKLRQENRMFEQKSFATLRDLFRWALRKADTIDELALNGFMLLAERVRKPEDRDKVRSVIETVLSRKGPRVKIDDQAVYSDLNSPEIAMYRSKARSLGVVWTKSMKRLFILVAHALRNNEPILLVGETGCGKTTVCQMLAEAFGKDLFIVNAHQNTETGDLIGSQRPIRNRASIEKQLREQLLEILQSSGVDVGSLDDRVENLLDAYDQISPSILSSLPISVRDAIQVQRVKLSALFEWSDGSLVHAMKTGQLFLLDEISLADDSVLERLNSVLEPERSLLLAEKGPVDSSVTATDGFQFLATMNPGGDYGKKELSPALRNRFTEIWVPSLYDMEDILEIVRAKLSPAASPHAEAIVNFSHWFNQTFNNSATSAVSIRDTLAWIEFINGYHSSDVILAIMHGAAMVYVDTLGANPAAMLSIAPAAIDSERKKCVTELSRLLRTDLAVAYSSVPDLTVSEYQVGFGPFSLPREKVPIEDGAFTFNAPTTRLNAMRTFRALQLTKPILIEGNPGVGKTTLVTAVAKSLGKRLVRINLSEQTDLMDLFGSDVPVEGAGVGSFTWRDAPFLSAMKDGDWVLLDEMNLASQSVLEGLNACLDHRAEAYIAELDQTFRRHPNFRLFAAQNPHHQGGGRKGLPASFVNRFTVVYADVFRPLDLLTICKQVFPDLNDDRITSLTRFVLQLDTNVAHSHRFGAQGSPWEFNLRDTLRWLQLLTSRSDLLPSGNASDFCDTIFRQRFRNSSDRSSVDALYSEVFGHSPDQRSLYHNLAADAYQVGLGLLARKPLTVPVNTAQPMPWTSHLTVIESLMMCVQQNWPAILVGPPGSGKTSVISHLAAITGANLVSFPMNADIDAMDLVGGYEQADSSRKVFEVLSRLVVFAQAHLVSDLLSNKAQTKATKIFDLSQQMITSSTGPSKQLLSELHSSLFAVYRDVPSDELLELLQMVENLVNQPEQVEKAHFEWVDGLLIKSLERGDWLVLDNANLCSSSVLDRLNSLLEPNGYLSINEHPMENGEARIVKPHSSFRIFLTMDPRNGELSRAMRNRAIELFLLQDEDLRRDQSDQSLSFGLESSIYRYRNFGSVETGDSQSLATKEYASIVVDHISFQDCPLQARYQEQVIAGLLDSHDNSNQDVVMESLELLSKTDKQWINRALNFPSLSLSRLDGGKVQVSEHVNRNRRVFTDCDSVCVVNSSFEQRCSCTIQCQFRSRCTLACRCLRRSTRPVQNGEIFQSRYNSGSRKKTNDPL
jgi:midasin